MEDGFLYENRTHSSFHSEEVQEIMGRKPTWILRWGITTILLILIGIIACCCIIKYPQTVIGTITLTSDNPPSELTAKTTGILDSVFVNNGDTIKHKQLLFLISSAAVYDDIVNVEDILHNSGLSESLTTRDISDLMAFHLGDLQDHWIDYLSACLDLDDYRTIDQIGRKKKLLAEQVIRSKEYLRKLDVQRQTLVQDLAYERKTLERDSLLFLRKAISQAEYETEQKEYVSKKNEVAGFEAAMENAQLNRLQLEQQIIELDTQRTTELADYYRRISQARNILLGQIALWKEQYAIIAPFDGIVSIQNVWGKGQRVNSGDIIVSISPIVDMNVIGRLKVPSSGFGKVQVGQDVNIKLNGFPYLEFGILKGKIVSISSVPENTKDGLAYTVNVSLMNGLNSTYHKEFPFVQNMDGEAEIITEDMRLIEQFVRPIRSLFVNR